MLDIFDTVEAWLVDGKAVSLATVTQTWGSAPRQIGAKMALTKDLSVIGSVSGGCVEGAVIDEGIEALEAGKGRLLTFGVSDEQAWDVGLSCGGQIEVFVEPLDTAWWSALQQSDNRPTRTATALAGELIGEKILLNEEGECVYRSPSLDDPTITAWTALANTVSKSQSVTWQDIQLFVDVQTVQSHLIIIGGVHVAIPLQAMARLVGFRVSIVDPRSAFATHERFPEADTIMHSYPDEALPQLGLDQHTYLAVLTHDPKIDDKALITALPSDASYIGVLSSSRTHKKRVQRLLKAGISQALIDRIHTPIGLTIGARTPEEIAVSIMAEIIAAQNGAHR